MARRRSIFDDRSRPTKPKHAPEPEARPKTMPPVNWDYDTPKPAMAKQEAPPGHTPASSGAAETPTPKLPSRTAPLLVAAVGGALLAVGVAAIVLASMWLRPESAVGALGY